MLAFRSHTPSSPDLLRPTLTGASLTRQGGPPPARHGLSPDKFSLLLTPDHISVHGYKVKSGGLCYFLSLRRVTLGSCSFLGFARACEQACFFPSVAAEAGPLLIDRLAVRPCG